MKKPVFKQNTLVAAMALSATLTLPAAGTQATLLIPSPQEHTAMMSAAHTAQRIMNSSQTIVDGAIAVLQKIQQDRSGIMAYHPSHYTYLQFHSHQMQSMNKAGEFLHASPKRFGSRFAIPLACQEAA